MDSPRWLAAVLLAVALPLFAQDAPAPKTLREMIDASIKQVEIFAGSEAKEPAQPLVALRWANNARGSEDGTTLLYIYEGRPLAAACLYPWDGKLVHDFESLSRGPLIGRKDGATIWHPQESGLKFAPIPDGPP